MKKVFIVGLVMFLVGSVVTVILSQAVDKEDLNKVKSFANKRGFQVVVDDVNKTTTSFGSGSKVGFNFSKNYKFPDMEKLKVEMTFGDVEIAETQRDELGVVLTTNVHKEIDLEKIVYKKDDYILIDLISAFKDLDSPSNMIQVNDKSVSISNAFRLKIELPKQYKKMNIDNVSADIKIDKIKLNELVINNVSGDLKLDHVTALSTKINSVSGDLEFDNLEFDTVKLDTVSGDAVFKFAVPTNLLAQITSVSGDLDGDDYFKKYISKDTLKLGEPKKKIKVDSISGDIEFSKQ